MSLVLSRSLGKIEAKTRPDYAAPNLPQLLLLGEAEATIEEGLADINRALEREDVHDFFATRGVLRYFKSMYPSSSKLADNHSKERYTRLQPHPAIQLPYEAIQDDSGAPDVEIVGQSVAGCDFPELVDYILTNTTLVGPEDPRIAFLDQLRGD